MENQSLTSWLGWVERGMGEGEREREHGKSMAASLED